MTSWAELRGMLLALAAILTLILVLIAWTPGVPGEMLLQSLRMHIIVVSLGVGAALLVAGARWRGLLFLAVVALAAAQTIFLVNELHARRTSAAAAPVAELNVLSFNTLTGNPRGAEVVRQIAAMQPDVAIIMETPGIEQHLSELETALPYHLGCDASATCDLSVWSRYPILESRMLLLPPFNRERLAVIKIDVGGTPMTIVGSHWSKPYFDEASWFEAEYLKNTLNELEGPILLSGDFNAAPWSDTLTYLTRQSRLVPPPSHPATWPVVAGSLGVPIDNMFTRGAAQIGEIEAGGDSFGSNHRYLLARVALYGAS